MANLLAILGAVFTLALGLGGLILPKLAQRITLLGPLPGYPGAIAEVRASFGGLYIGVGVAVLMALWAEQDVVGASFVAALAWLGLALGRIVSMITDRSANAWNWTSLFVELGVGAMLLAPFVAHIGAAAAA